MAILDVIRAHSKPAVGFAAAALLLMGCEDNKTDSPLPNAAAAALVSTPSNDNPLVRLQMADQLAAYARDQKDPIALAVAARIHLEISPQPKESDINSTGPAEDPRAETMLREAESWSQDDRFVTALIEDIRSIRSKGRKGRPLFTEGQAPPGQEIRLTETFEGNTSAGVYIQSEPHGQVRLTIYDQDNKLICEASSVLSRSLCFWTPPTESSFTIKIINTSEIDASYSLYTD